MTPRPMRAACLSLFLAFSAAPVWANPGVSGAPNMLVMIALTCLTLFLIYWSGAGEIMQAAGIKRWDVRGRIGAMIAMLVLGTIGAWPLFIIGVAGYALLQGTRMIRWGLAASRPPFQETPPYLAAARPRRLLAGGAMSVAAAVGAVALCGWFFWQLDIARLLRRSNEGATKGNLGAIRSALADGGKYLPTLPKAKTPNYHPDSSSVQYLTGVQYAAGGLDDSGGWAYVVSGPSSGTVLINCTHTDSKGSAWSAY